MYLLQLLPKTLEEDKNKIGETKEIIQPFPRSIRSHRCPLFSVLESVVLLL
jgi:hypothetical protein